MAKKEALKKYENAKSQNLVDSLMIPLCDKIFQKKNFFTTSSCAGRIALMNVEDIGIKEPGAFYRKWHRKVSFKELLEALKNNTSREIWFKLDPLILHIATNTLDNVSLLLKILHSAGFKRFGMINYKPGKFVVEFQGNESMSLPIKKEDSLLVSEEYLSFILEKANKKLEKNYSLLEKTSKLLLEKLPDG